MNLVIPLLNNNNYDQLRFALRSITKHHDITRCIVVGGKPKWYIGDHIPHKDYSPVFKEQNIRDKVLAAAETIYGDFLFANDDHILLSPINKVYNKGMLKDELSKRFGNGTYSRCLKNTFERYGDVPLVDTHCPMVMNSELAKRTAFDWPKFGIALKTCYSEENKIPSEYYPDCKVSSLREVSGRLWFSIRDNFNLKELFVHFPERSIFEQ